MVPSALHATRPQSVIDFPQSFLLGRTSSFDVGPPFNFYEILAVKPEQNGVRVDRVIITPPGPGCSDVAKVEVKTVFIQQSVPALLEGRNPCAMAEKVLSKERKRCRRCLVFSSVNVIMQTSCGDEARTMRMDILDRDIYGSRVANTPTITSWTMRLLARLDQGLGPGVMEKPVFELLESPAVQPARTEILDDLASGKFDGLFQAPTSVSELYKRSLHQPLSVKLVSSDPLPPLSYEAPKYSPLARLARIGGSVEFTARIRENGTVADLKFISGNRLLQNSVEKSVEGWKYPSNAAGLEIRVKLQFEASCLQPTN